jgi:hypothetical protein
MANQIVAGNSTNGGTAISTDTSGTLNIVTGSGSGANAITIDASQNVTFANAISVAGNGTVTGNLTVTGTVTGSNTGSLGVGQTWTDVTASRAGATTYTNSTGKPIAWMLVCSAVNGVGILIDSAQVIPAGSVQAGYPIGCFIIQPGSTYQLTRTVSVTINKWFELR